MATETELEAAAAAAPAAANADLLGAAPADPSHEIPHASAAARASAPVEGGLKIIERVQPSHSDPKPPRKVYAWQKHKAARK